MTGLSTSGMTSRVQRGRAQLKTLLTRCWQIELDRRGGIIHYRPHGDTCDCRAGAPKPQRLEAAPAPPPSSRGPNGRAGSDTPEAGIH
jgi:hypothetical protein